MPEAAEFVLDAEHVGKTFKGFRALHDVNLRVRKGSIHGLIGPNGAGKTTLLNLLTSTLIPTTGRVKLAGVDIAGRTPSQVAQMGLVRSFQICAVFPHMTVLQNVRLAIHRKEGGTFAFWAPASRLRRLDERAMSLLKSVGLGDMATRKAAELSYGRKRALEFATTLATEPNVLLLDEPMAGLGIEEIPRLVALIREFSPGRTIVLVEHHLPAVAELCDSVTVLNRGEVLAGGSYQEVAALDSVLAAYLGKGRQPASGAAG
jgi:branched-chain amino acid transport system ATP-binding protein